MITTSKAKGNDMSGSWWNWICDCSLYNPQWYPTEPARLRMTLPQYHWWQICPSLQSYFPCSLSFVFAAGSEGVLTHMINHPFQPTWFTISLFVFSSDANGKDYEKYESWATIDSGRLLLKYIQARHTSFTFLSKLKVAKKIFVPEQLCGNNPFFHLSGNITSFY